MWIRCKIHKQTFCHFKSGMTNHHTRCNLFLSKPLSASIVLTVELIYTLKYFVDNEILLYHHMHILSIFHQDGQLQNYIEQDIIATQWCRYFSLLGAAVLVKEIFSIYLLYMCILLAAPYLKYNYFTLHVSKWAWCPSHIQMNFWYNVKLFTVGQGVQLLVCHWTHILEALCTTAPVLGSPETWKLQKVTYHVLFYTQILTTL